VDRLTELDGLAEPEGLTEGLFEELGLAEDEGLAEPEGDVDVLADGLSDLEALADGLLEALGLVDLLTEAEGLAEPEAEALGLVDLDTLADGLREALADGDTEDDGDRDGEELTLVTPVNDAHLAEPSFPTFTKTPAVLAFFKMNCAPFLNPESPVGRIFPAPITILSRSSLKTTSL